MLLGKAEQLVHSDPCVSQALLRNQGSGLHCYGDASRSLPRLRLQAAIAAVPQSCDKWNTAEPCMDGANPRSHGPAPKPRFFGPTELFTDFVGSVSLVGHFLGQLGRGVKIVSPVLATFKKPNTTPSAPGIFMEGRVKQTTSSLIPESQMARSQPHGSFSPGYQEALFPHREDSGKGLCCYKLPWQNHCAAAERPTAHKQTASSLGRLVAGSSIKRSTRCLCTSSLTQ